jgi:hypothetical protein
MSTFREALQKRDFIVTAELNLALETDVAAIVEQATILDAHTDAIQLPDSPNARAQLTPLALSNILLKHGIEPLAHDGHCFQSQGWLETPDLVDKGGCWRPLHPDSAVL